jgi:four helix bundle protein
MIWQKAHALVLGIYQLTSGMPESERFGIISQMRRSASSIPTNIAEGCGRQSDAEFVKFLHYGAGSASELQYQLILCRDLEYISQEEWKAFDDKIVVIRKMIIALIKKIKK